MDETCGFECVVCLSSAGSDVAAYGRCSRSCATKTYYHAQCHDEMRSMCGLECAICRNPSTLSRVVDSSVQSHDDSARDWLMFDSHDASEYGGAAYILIAVLVALVLSPPLLLARMFCLYFKDLA